jgi:hypothetical protein
MMKKLIVLLMVVGLMGLMAGMGEAADTDDVKINLFVTPIVTTSLTVSSTFYYFGLVDVETTTGSVSALTLTNDGDIDITVEKEVLSTGDWFVTRSSTTEDGFILWAMAATSQPSHAAFVAASSSFSKAGLSTLNDLTETGGAQVEMSKDETKDLWFRLDMPYAVSLSAEQKLQIRLMATSN